MRKIGDVIPSTDADALMYTTRVPLGVVGVITPWNFPVAIPIWKIAPALIYGNTVVFKPATETGVTAAKCGMLAGSRLSGRSIEHGDRLGFQSGTGDH